MPHTRVSQSGANNPIKLFQSYTAFLVSLTHTQSFTHVVLWGKSHSYNHQNRVYSSEQERAFAEINTMCKKFILHILLSDFLAKWELPDPLEGSRQELWSYCWALLLLASGSQSKLWEVQVAAQNSLDNQRHLLPCPRKMNLERSPNSITSWID